MRSHLISNWLDGQVAGKRLPFGEVVVLQHGKEVARHFNPGATKNDSDSIYRIYSMTKPIVSLALMLLHEQGKVQLGEPVWKYLGEPWKKKNMCVVDDAQSKLQGKLVTMPCRSSITVHQLLTHTSGLSHGLSPPELGHPVDTYYAQHGLNAGEVLMNASTKFDSVQAFCDELAKAPLSFQPGQQWQYSWSVELIGRIVEVISQQTLEEFLAERVFSKLGMSDTSFFLAPSKQSRLSDMFLPHNQTSFKPKKRPFVPLRYCSGSGGLYSTTNDYVKFCAMLANQGRAASGEAIVSPYTLSWITSNHLKHPLTGQPSTVRELGVCEIAKDTSRGVGFGLGVAVVDDNRFDGALAFPGEYYWSGAASTFFFVNPADKVAVVFVTQLLMPQPRDVPLHAQLHAVVYGALTKL